jgi:hypothetical protein
MKRISLLSLAFLATGAVFAQNAKTYAITSVTGNDYYWGNIREIDLATGKVVKTLFESDKTQYESVDAVSKASINSSKALPANGVDKPFGFGVAASAFDRKHNRLYFSPMHKAEIRYIDLDDAAAKFHYNTTSLISPASPNGFLTEENHLTRMVLIGKVGYAITNDGNHIFQFTTGKKPVITDLGALIDDASNGSISVKNKCTSWGGDIVANEDGLIYLISANKHVFTIDVASKVAKYKGQITGIPAQFTTNGAVVSDAKSATVTSANPQSGFYNVNMETLVATLVPNSVTNYSISDLANELLLEGAKKNTPVETTISKELVANDNVNVFPNPITSNTFKISLDDLTTGNYTLTVTDLIGRQVYNKRIVVNSDNQVENVDLGKKPSNGLYLLKLVDATNKNVFVGKLIVE